MKKRGNDKYGMVTKQKVTQRQIKMRKGGSFLQAIIWLGIVIILIVVEIITLGLTTIWFAGGAAVACIAALLGASLLVQVILFMAVSVVLLFATRPVAMKYMNKNRTKTNAASLIGREAVVIQTIENLKAQGQVMVNGMEWTARSVREGEVIEKDTVVKIERIDGVKLIVKKTTD